MRKGFFGQGHVGEIMQEVYTRFWYYSRLIDCEVKLCLQHCVLLFLWAQQDS
jgi:hypothetical protein